MSEAAATPPTAAAEAPKPWNARQWVADRAPRPKQDYSAAWKAEDAKPPEAEAPKGDGPGASVPGTGTPTSDAPAGGPDVSTGTREEGAKTFLAMYDMLMGQVCEGIVNNPKDYPAEKFHLKDSLRRDAQRQLGVCLEKWKVKDLPPEAMLVLIVLMGGFANWTLIRKAEKERIAKAKPAAPIGATPQEQAEARLMALVGRLQAEQVKQAGNAAATATAPAPANPHPYAGVKKERPRNGPQCSECTNRCRTGKVVCSQECAAKRTHRMRSEAKRAGAGQVTDAVIVT